MMTKTGMNEVKAFFFDVDDTVYDQSKPFKDAVNYVENLTVDFPFEEVFKLSRQYSDILWNQYCNQEISLEDLRVQRLVRAFDDFGFHLEENRAKEIQEKYEERQQHIQLFDQFIECIRKLENQGFLIGLITNGPVEHQWRKIHALKLDRYISKDHIFISDAVGIAKPDPRIFLHVNEVLGIKPENCYYVGDSWRNDVVPPLKAGWNSIWYNYRHREPETNDTPTKVVYSYSELEK
ncbi:HAD family hydrolase [Anaerobacillus sp. CMMVII]|uniref:HAD family hydrolase n=1 Tax=Anaerobacillus sp. CMMVII TaxID=2755588 RepID=UPI0021B8450A|nr:HAD family hydrolase [Anaerobacillus sp. CMMVII]MCT8137082.1 HAD family hydrolase [Anaerobacillus sp. CMMVII]